MPPTKSFIESPKMRNRGIVWKTREKQTHKYLFCRKKCICPSSVLPRRREIRMVQILERRACFQKCPFSSSVPLSPGDFVSILNLVGGNGDKPRPYKDLYYPKRAIGERVGRDCMLVEFVGALGPIPSLRDPWRIQQRPGPKMR